VSEKGAVSLYGMGRLARHRLFSEVRPRLATGTNFLTRFHSVLPRPVFTCLSTSQSELNLSCAFPLTEIRVTEFSQNKGRLIGIAKVIRAVQLSSCSRCSQITVNSQAICELPEMSGGLNRSVQHWLAVYSPGFQSPRFFAVVD
jgi:hypothetical protein